MTTPQPGTRMPDIDITPTTLISTVETILQDPDIETRNARLRLLGRDWMLQARPPQQLTEAGLQAAARTSLAAADVITELLMGYSSAREEEQTREWDNHLIRLVLELDGLHRVISAANSTLDLEASLQAVVEIVAEVMNVEVCSIYLYEQAEHVLRLRATYGLNPAMINTLSFPPGTGITGQAAEIGRPIAVADVRKDSRFRTIPSLHEDEYLSILCVPILLFTAQRLQMTVERLQGVISIQTKGPREFTPEEIAYLEVVAGELAFSIANAQLFQQTDERLHQKIRELTTLQRVTAALAATLDPDSLLWMIAEQAVLLGRADRADIFQQVEGGAPRLVASWGPGSSSGIERFIEKVLRERRPIAVLNTYVDERFPELAELAYREGFHSIFCIPLRAGDEIRGALCLLTREARHFDYEQVQLLSTFADEAAIAMENARLYEAVRRSLTIKSTLLQEMHHRVRNNLQTISSLLQLQARRLNPGTPGRLALEESVSRIQAIAVVHNLLCREDIGVTTIQAIARQIVDNIRVGLVGEVPVHFEVTGVPVAVASREATTLALVMNELISNALHHGIAEQGGTIGIDAWREDATVLVQVRDDGPGIRRERHNKSQGLGLQIIETLVTKDLHGSFNFDRRDGWSRATLRFPASAPADE
ncbi:MAG: hypothetical protein KatS3mg057_1435 [Herpetosiphonaceae bacterium]|nr:MAG: hypothetical protein KatS3mg057_1435 [Herpetosiphonaceae bacterium]